MQITGRTAMSDRQIVLAAPVRTPIGTFGGSLKDTAAPALGAAAIRESLRRSGLGMDAIDTVVIGNVIQGGPKRNPGGQAPTGAGRPGAAPRPRGNRGGGPGGRGARQRRPQTPPRL